MSNMMITSSDARRAIASAEAAHTRLKNLRKQGEEITEQVGRTIVTGGTGFVLGLMSGAGIAEVPWLKVPLTLGVGIAGHAARLLGLGGRHGATLSNVGDGGLTSYLHVLGHGIGTEHWGKAKSSGEMSGALAEQLARLAA